MIEAAALIGLAGWRLASLFVFESGPFSIFERIRDFFAPPGPLTQLGILLTCIYCCSVWTCGLFAALWFLVPYGVEATVTGAAMGGALLVEQVINRKTLTS